MPAEPCVHYWRIEPACGPVSQGTCALCGTTRGFNNSIPDGDERNWRDAETRRRKQEA